jgi:hypothetical protein
VCILKDGKEGKRDGGFTGFSYLALRGEGGDIHEERTRRWR